MKKLFCLVALGTVALVFPLTGLSAEPKPAKTPDTAAPTGADGTRKSPTGITTPPGEARAIGMRAKVDSINANAKSFSHKNADGTVVKHFVTETTDIKNGSTPAKFEDLKVGDTVSGSRRKKSPTEYEVVKITEIVAATKETKAEDRQKKREDRKKR